MKANRLQKLWIVIQSLWITFFVSAIILFKISFKQKYDREIADKLLKKWITRLFHIIKLSYDIIDPHQVKLKPNHPYIIMSNHASHYDIPLILSTFPNKHVRMIAKKELFNVPIWGHAMKASEFISIDRDNPRQAVKDLAIAHQKMQSGIIPWIAPEGTRTRTGKLGLFKKGGFMIAKKTGATIIPVGIRGSYGVLPPKTLDFNIGSHITIHIGQPIDASQYADQKQLMKDVEMRIRNLIGEPTENVPHV